jgi:hypothetical protein
MYRAELNYFVALTIIILFSQFLPAGLLLLLDSIIVRIAIVIGLLYLITLGPTAGIFGLIAIAIMYLERNKRKVSIAAKKLDAIDWKRPTQATVEEASKPQMTVPVNEFDKPQEEESYFIPSDTCDTDNFEPVAPTINEKAVLATIYPLNRGAPEAGDASDQLYEELGFGHIRGVETVGN